MYNLAQTFNIVDPKVFRVMGVRGNDVTLQAWRTVRCGRVGFTKATARVLGFWIVVGDRGPLRDVGRH
jgi:hypothetical protein